MTARNPRAVLRDYMAAANAAGLDARAYKLWVAVFAHMDPTAEWNDWSIRQLGATAGLWYGHARRAWSQLIAAGLIVAKPAEPGRAALWHIGDLTALVAAYVAPDDRAPVDENGPRAKRRGPPAPNGADPPAPNGADPPAPNGADTDQIQTTDGQIKARRPPPPLVIRVPGQQGLPGVDDLAANRAERRRRQRRLANAATGRRWGYP